MMMGAMGCMISGGLDTGEPIGDVDGEPPLDEPLLPREALTQKRVRNKWETSKSPPTLEC